MELAENVVQEWLKQPDDQGRSWKSAVLNGALLWRMVKYFMPNAGQAFKKAWDFPEANDIQNAYQQRLGARNRFSGTMPVGFARWHIPLVMVYFLILSYFKRFRALRSFFFSFVFAMCLKKREYYVSEKTDGVRYFLVVASGKAVMVDRSNCAFTTSGGAEWIFHSS